MLLNPTYGKRGLHPTRDTCGLGGAWQSSCRHHWPCAYPRRRHDGLEWSCRPTDEVARATWPAPMLRRLRQKQQLRPTWSWLFSHVNLQEEIFLKNDKEGERNGTPYKELVKIAHPPIIRRRNPLWRRESHGPAARLR